MANYIVKELTGEKFVVFEATKLPVGSTLPFDIYSHDRNGPKVLFKKGMVFSPLEKTVVANNAIDRLYAKYFDTSPSELEHYLGGKQRTISSFLEDHVEFKKYTAQKDNSFHLDKSLLSTGTKINFPLYLINKASFTPLLVATENETAEIPANLRDSQGDISINKSDLPLYLDYLTATHKNAPNLRPLLVRETARTVMNLLMDTPRDIVQVRKIILLVNSLIDIILENMDTFYGLILIKNNDYYEYTHSVNTALFSIRLGIAAGLSRHDLEKLGIGTILLDIGKSVIHKDILNKQGKLDQTEYMVFQSHVIEGANILRGMSIIPPEALIPVMQHHEKLNGRGYPYKLKDKEINLFGRISAIADVYDAMVTARPFRPAQSPFKALSIIAKETTNYDANLLKLFIQILAKMK
jgi:HD-GYP domain-containing protein (c-di-GMP phosphodiesterase class II)